MLAGRQAAVEGPLAQKVIDDQHPQLISSRTQSNWTELAFDRSATQIRAPHSTHINTFWLLSNSHHNYGKTGEFEFFLFFFECLTSNRGNNSVNLFTTFYMVMKFMGPLLKTTQTVVS